MMNGSSCRSRPVNEVTMITDVKKMVQNAMKNPWNFIKYRKIRFMMAASDMVPSPRPERFADNDLAPFSLPPSLPLSHTSARTPVLGVETLRFARTWRGLCDAYDRRAATEGCTTWNDGSSTSDRETARKESVLWRVYVGVEQIMVVFGVAVW